MLIQSLDADTGPECIIIIIRILLFTVPGTRVRESRNISDMLGWIKHRYFIFYDVASTTFFSFLIDHCSVTTTTSTHDERAPVHDHNTHRHSTRTAQA